MHSHSKDLKALLPGNLARADIFGAVHLNLSDMAKAKTRKRIEACRSLQCEIM